MSGDEVYQAIVEKIVAGRHGPYAVARVEEIGSVTFSLKEPVWQEADWPEPGMYVLLKQLRKKRAGWRAQHGRFITPSDQQSSNSKEQQGGKNRGK